MATKRKRWILIMQRILGGIYFVGGALKFSPVPEDVNEVMKEMAAANADNFLGPPSQFFADNPMVIKLWVGLAMIAAGIVFLRNKQLVREAAVGTILMLICFMTFLFAAHGMIVVIVDLFFITASALVIWDHTRSLNGSQQQTE